jgi:hypothetical protein
MKITNIYTEAGVPGQTPIGGSEAEVWEELRDATMRDECVLLVETHQHAEEEFNEVMEKGEFDRELVEVLSLEPSKKTIHIPAQESYESKWRTFEGGPLERELLQAHALNPQQPIKLSGKVKITTTIVPATPATTKEIEVKRYLDFSSKKNARHVASEVKKNHINIVVIWEPYVENGDLDHISALPGDTHVVIFHQVCEKVGVVVEGDGGRKEDYTYSTLPEDEADDLIEHLLAKFALTLITAPSYTGKTHFAIEAGLSLVTGQAFLGHFPIKEKVPVRYFVPELSAGRFKRFMERIASSDVWKQHEDSFIVRPLDGDLLMLDSAEMIEKCRGYYVFLDTLGYFTGVDNESSYSDAIKFATKINHLIREGCLGVCGLYHPPKYSKNKKETGNILTIENQILGSAGYGGLLRSLLAMRNLHQDSNEGLWCYVQGLKNPGLGKPFQFKGFPLEYLGDSDYLSELLKGDGSKREQALAMMKEGRGREEIRKALGVSPRDLTKWKQEQMFDSDEGENQ